jgi:hypothetical protein
MTINKTVVRFLFFPFVVTLSGCSPYIYKEEVGKFQDGVVQASKMLDVQKEFLSKRGLEINRSDLLNAGSPRLIVSEGCAKAIICLEAVAYSTSLGEKCSVDYVEIGASDNAIDIYKTVHKAAISACDINAMGELGLGLEVPAQLSAQRKVIASLNNYAKALAGIVDAEDKNALSQSASKACSSTQQLYSTASSVEVDSEDLSEEEKKIQKDKLEKDGKAITAVCGLVTEIGSAILDRRRLEVLHRVVKESNSNIDFLATYLANESRKVSSIVLRSGLERLSDSVGATIELQGKDKEYLVSIDSAVKENDKFKGVLKSSAEGVFLSMGEAHNKLKEALDDPKTQLEAAIKSIEKFHKVAEDAHEAIKAISDDGTAE